MTFLFHRLIQSKRNPLRYIFALLGNTRGSTPITHISHKYYWTTESSSLLAPSSLMMGNSPLIVSRNVPNEPIIYSTGTALEGGWTLWINPDARNTTQGIFLGYISKMEAHLACWYNYSFSPLLIQIGCMLAPTTCHPAPYLDALIWWTRKVLILNTMDPCEGAIILWTHSPCPPFHPSQIVPGKRLPLLSLV